MPRHHNRIGNVLQNIVGVNCRIDKPVNQEGRGWKIIIDGSSDISDGVIQPPWENGQTNTLDQFRVIPVTNGDKFYVEGGTWHDCNPVVPNAWEGLPYVEWYPESDDFAGMPDGDEGDVSKPCSLEYYFSGMEIDDAVKVWAVYIPSTTGRFAMFLMMTFA
jgi:hypothetical protein